MSVLATNPLLIGVTGGIGSGKTSFAKCLQALGQQVYNSDTEAKNLVYLPEIKNQIIDLLGSEAYVNDEYQRAFVGQKVFGDAGLLQQLNAIIHPAVAKHFEDWKAQHQSQKFLFKETALLFELGLNLKMDYSLLVTASQNIREARVKARDGHSAEAIAQIMARQMPEEEKIKLADFVIYNETSLPDLQDKAQNFLQQLHEINP